MTVLVTGASGHIGGNLVRALLDDGRQVRALVREERESIAQLDVESVGGDVCDAKAMSAACHGVEVVFHLAAKISITGDPTGSVSRANVDGVRCVARAALGAGARRFIHFSSVHAFDIALGSAITEQSPRPPASAPAYNRTKWAGERALREVMADGLDAVIVNPTGVVGPFDFKPSRMGRALMAMAGGNMPSLVDGGFNWVDVRDIVRGALAAETSGQTGENYLLGGQWASFSELAAITAEVTGRAPPRLTAPMWLLCLGAPWVEVYGRMRGQEPLYTRESLAALRGSREICWDKAREHLGYDARPLRQTLRDTLAWLSQTGRLGGQIDPHGS